MKKQGLAFIALVFILGAFPFSSCKKINEATELGSDLIPPIDNVNTFDTTLSVETVNALFTNLEDTTASSTTQFFGSVNNDPLFGKTEASMYFQLSPETIKKPFPSKDSIIGLDSVILVLNTLTVWGDTTAPQQVQVFEIPTSQPFSLSENYLISKKYINSLGPSLGPAKTFVPSSLNDSVQLQKEKVANQLRIPLNNSVGTRFLNYDTTNAYASQAAFKTFFNGLAVVPQNNGTANALIGVNLNSGTTNLSFYLRYKNGGKIDTTVFNFILNDSSAIANFIDRDYSGSELASAVTGTTPDELVYIQSSPGSYAKIKIPALGGLNNRVVHLAELIVEQVYDPLAPLLTPPTYLYVDAFDASANRYRTIPSDVLLTPLPNPVTGALDNDTISYSIANPAEFGMVPKQAKDASNNLINNWRFNLTRYVQRVVNKSEPAQDLRLYSPMPVIRSLSSGIEQWIGSGQPYAIGRTRVGGGSHPTQKMRLRIVYSKL